jgi:hypothetical protein
MVSEPSVARPSAMPHRPPMKPPIRPAIVAACALMLAACAGRTTPAPFHVLVRGPATAGGIEVDGRLVSLDELLAIARPQATPGRRAGITSDMTNVPYRCIGGVIYTLQTAGFREVGFFDPPARTEQRE